MAELLDRRVALEDLVGSATARRLGDHLADSAGDARRRSAGRSRPSPAVSWRTIRPTGRPRPWPGSWTPGSVEVAELADVVGLSTRQLHRRCTAAFGYGPATLARILRFQRFVHAARRAKRAEQRRRARAPARPTGMGSGGAAPGGCP